MAATPAASHVDEVLAGLRQRPRHISFKYFYDAAGTRLFDAILAQPAYYPARVEQALMAKHGAAMARALGERRLLIEYGAGNPLKTEALLAHLVDPIGYVPIDISSDQLAQTTGQLAERFPNVAIWPLEKDFTAPFSLPPQARGAFPRTAYFPGCTIWNLPAQSGRRLLSDIATQVGTGGQLLIAVDYAKDPAVLRLAYDDPAGATAAFNRNVLTHVNRVCAGNFDPMAFAHQARWVPEQSRMEMSLVSQADQRVTVSGVEFAIAAGEAILTEVSYKLTPSAFTDLCHDVGFSEVAAWHDDDYNVSIALLEVAKSG